MKEKIVNVFIELINTMKYENISVKLICEKCYISRTTFYNYFKSINDILNLIENQVLDDMDNIYKEYNYLSILDLKEDAVAPNFYEMYKYIYNHKELFIFIYGDNCPKAYLNKTIKSINNKLSNLFLKYMNELQAREACNICSSFLISSAKALISNDTTLTPKQLSILLKNTIKDLIVNKDIYFS